MWHMVKKPWAAAFYLGLLGFSFWIAVVIVLAAIRWLPWWMIVIFILFGGGFLMMVTGAWDDL